MMKVLGKKDGDRVMKPVIMVTNGRVQGLMVEQNGALMNQNMRVGKINLIPQV